jgi:virginiamycin B lyase
MALSILTLNFEVSASTIAEWGIPTSSAEPFFLALSPTEQVYFTESSGNKIGRLDPATGIFTEWTLPTETSKPWDIAFSDGAVYFTEFLGNKIGRLDPSSDGFTEWVVPTSSSSPAGIATYGGQVYFTENSGNKIGRLDPSTGEFKEWRLPTEDSQPYGITISNGLVYFTEANLGRIGRLNPLTDIFTEWSGVSASDSRNIVVSEGLVYFTGYAFGQIARLDPSNGVFTEWKVKGCGVGAPNPWGIDISGGVLYFAVSQCSRIDSLDPLTGIGSSWDIGGGSSWPYGVATSGNDVFFTDGWTANSIGRLVVAPVSTVTTFLPSWARISVTTISLSRSNSTASSTFISTTTRTSIAYTVSVVTIANTSSVTMTSDTVTTEPHYLYQSVRGLNNKLYWRCMTTQGFLTPWATAQGGSTSAGPAIAEFNGRVHVAVKGSGDTRIYTNSMDPTSFSWDYGSWSVFWPGATPSSPALAASSSYLYLAVRGMDNRIYWRRMDTLGAWSSWSAVPYGSTDTAPSIAFFNGRLYMAAKGNGNSNIYLSNMNSSTLVWSGWTKLPGGTPSNPSLAASPLHLYIVARGTDSRIYWRRMDTSGSWSAWAVTSGSTDAAPAVHFFSNSASIYGGVYVVVKGNGSNSIYMNSLNPDTLIWSGWTKLNGGTPSSPGLG